MAIRIANFGDDAFDLVAEDRWVNDTSDESEEEGALEQAPAGDEEAPGEEEQAVVEEVVEEAPEEGEEQAAAEPLFLNDDFEPSSNAWMEVLGMDKAGEAAANLDVYLGLTAENLLKDMVKQLQQLGLVNALGPQSKYSEAQVQQLLVMMREFLEQLLGELQSASDHDEAERDEEADAEHKPLESYLQEMLALVARFQQEPQKMWNFLRELR